MRGSVAGRRERRDDRVAELDDRPVRERLVRELDVRAHRQVRHGARPLDQLGQARDVVRLHVGLQDGDDRRARPVGRIDVRVDELLVWIDERQPSVSQAPER